MERINYRITLDAHKNGIQRTLQGFEIADNMSRRISVNLTASGDTYEIPFDHVTAVMYVTTPNAKEPSIEACTIEDNTVIYDMLPITEEGITEMQMKLIETRMDGAKSVLLSPKFAIEVSSSNADDGGATQTPTFTALEDALARAKSVYDARLLRIEIDDACVFRAYYADGTVYENYALHEALYNGNALLSESWAKGGTGIREGEDTNNSMYFSNASRSAAEDADMVYADARGLLNEAIRHTAFTSFLVDFENGNLEYMSANSTFDVNEENGDLEFHLSDDYDPEKLVGDVVREFVEQESAEIDAKIKGKADVSSILDSMSEVNANTEADKIAGALALKELGEQLGAIESKTIWADISTTPSHFEAIKSYWEEFELGKIYLVNVMCGSQKIAIVQKYVYAHNYGSVFIFGYDQKCLMYYELVNGEWVTYDVANKNDLSNYLPLDKSIVGTFLNPICVDALRVDFSNPQGAENKPCTVHKDSAIDCPPDFYFGVREVLWFATDHVTVRLTGLCLDNYECKTTRIWTNTYYEGVWRGWEVGVVADDLANYLPLSGGEVNWLMTKKGLLIGEDATLSEGFKVYECGSSAQEPYAKVATIKIINTYADSCVELKMVSRGRSYTLYFQFKDTHSYENITPNYFYSVGIPSYGNGMPHLHKVDATTFDVYVPLVSYDRVEISDVVITDYMKETMSITYCFEKVSSLPSSNLYAAKMLEFADISTISDLANYLPLSGGTIKDGNLTLNRTSASPIILRMLNTKRSVSTHVNEHAEFGFYDDTNAEWIMYSRPDTGNVYIPHTTYVNDSKVLTAKDFTVSGDDLILEWL